MNSTLMCLGQFVFGIQSLPYDELKRVSRVKTTDETLAAIQELTGQEYVDVYGARVKTGDLADGGADAFVLPRPGGGEPPVVERRAR